MFAALPWLLLPWPSHWVWYENQYSHKSRETTQPSISQALPLACGTDWCFAWNDIHPKFETLQHEDHPILTACQGHASRDWTPPVREHHSASWWCPSSPQDSDDFDDVMTWCWEGRKHPERLLQEFESVIGALPTCGHTSWSGFRSQNGKSPRILQQLATKCLMTILRPNFVALESCSRHRLQGLHDQMLKHNLYGAGRHWHAMTSLFLFVGFFAFPSLFAFLDVLYVRAGMWIGMQR